MYLDLEEAGGAVERRTDICIVGAGAAGIIAARRLLAAGREVTLLESGGTDYEPHTAALNAGRSVGQDYYPLESARLRLFGGTTAIWGGRCAELDPIDLEQRDWVPGSGWPIGYAALADYYRQARPLFGLAADAPEPARLAADGFALPPLDPKVLATPLWSFDDRHDRFTLARARDLLAHPRCHIVAHATATDIRTDPAARAVTAITATAARSGATLTVVAGTVILAAGGIENARLLLASRATMPMGLGNAHDQVGRYFMEHPHARGGRIVTPAPWRVLRSFGRRQRVRGRDLAAVIAPSAALQRREGILNTSLSIAPRRPATKRQFFALQAYNKLKHDVAPTRSGRALWRLAKRSSQWAQRRVDPLHPWLLHQVGRVELALLVRAEQAPNPDSRVTLDRQTDAIGMPRVVLDWRLSEIDRRSVAVTVRALGDEMGRLGLGRTVPEAWLEEPGTLWCTDPTISAHPIGGYHHLGTTRMAETPRTGVTDGYGQVHGLANLFVIGSSVFPTGGWANPTLTIAALALRTADRIAGR